MPEPALDTRPWFKHPSEGIYTQGAICPPGWLRVDAHDVSQARAAVRARLRAAREARAAAKRAVKRDTLIAAGFTEAQADAILL